ncbi:extracellular solute-binding protein [Paenibacillus humicola]|uniref:extracellular solute-binding protein n=1 Tax=Paenibacillus humicola TaxID=3110540 RepID=UPI00237BC6D4|nr:extracellular solute-binding protein [Paenibacillus humicola]
MRKTNKAASALLAAMLILTSLLAGCGGSGSNAADGDGSANGAKAEGSQPAAGKPVLKMLQGYAKHNYDTPVSDFLEQATGYKVQYDKLPQDNASDKLNLIMSSGADYDLVKAGKQDYFRFALNGALTDLTPLIDKYGPNIKAAISAKSFDAVKVDGKIYAIPDLNTSYVGGGVMVRTDWLEKLNLKMPATLDEFTAMLKAFKEKDPAGNGKQNISFTIAGTLPMVDGILGAFGLYNSWNPEDGKLVSRAFDPKLRDYLAYMKSLYDQGLLDPEFATNKEETADEKFTSGRAGAEFVPWYKIPTLDEALKKNVPGAKYAYIPSLAGPDGQKGYGVGQGFDWYMVVPTTAKHPEDAIKYINATLDPETFKEMYIGKEGVDYKVENGQYLPIQPAFFDDRGYSSDYTMGRDEAHFLDYWQARLRKSEPMFDAFKQINDIPDEMKQPDVLGFSTFLPNLAQDSQKLDNLVRDYSVNAIVGGVTDGGLKNFQNEWLQAGGEATDKEVNDWHAKSNEQQ